MQVESLKSYNNHYKKVNKSTIIPDKLIKIYIKAYQIYEDKAMLERVVVGNQRYISKIAYKYSNNNHYIIDLIDEANIGLINAINAFDTSVESTFLTYATFHIRKSIIDYLYKYSNHSHIPFTVINNSYAVYRFIDKYFQKHNIDPTIVVIAKELKMNKHKIINIIDYKNNLIQRTSLTTIEPDTLSKEHEELINEIEYILSEEDKELLYDYYGINTIKLTSSELLKKYNIKSNAIKTKINKLILKLKDEFLN